MLNAVGQAQNILLLGGTSEIGLAIVTELASRGGNPTVTLAARKGSPRIDAAVQEVSAAGASKVRLIDFDATDFDSHPGVIDAAFEDGDVDVAIVAFGTLGDQEQLWQDQAAAVASAQTNYTAPISVGVLLGQKFKAQGHGTIIAMSSVAGQKVRRSNFVYGASKAGMDGFYLQLGEALRDYGVNVTVVRPGQVRTKMTEGLDEAPLTVDKEEVAQAAVDAALGGKSNVFVHKLFGPISLVLKAIPAPIMRKLSF
ncbi:decaprenylphospho-beta-D-erythro-pentofuranosid-2-ulose 2-reductase [Corynebacterium imitans]|uniref:decaprenylphospho-beta-D-erythro-pentofuranosid- 2-ulose 2-reductase n=1 Tax=Corynebacterium imitans TaxID=156978 RepID=UPI0025503B46|nr:decaprenylphospho-beta-D-erythro-pentofuranosid-2-ulose 2-reductase [Corynebacterium imitans]MDK8305298.1 decaprenylphospho-beta-D-erythro-pentofuranosid-2-ulose 2-reductase [Corynebacterium imitans]MDK8636401.1 decaprenylphospho-beta-D-erythro-pentofuranosid-2-ulose 2-reductase [Corynebacterium imitans]MDK8771599.1 decaprenylphospho-beta-D-erythro-pentofuranosid-2-ulose 2-reductase [Corynebacterium imitans]